LKGKTVDPSPILILCTDLIFSTKITGTAKALGRPFAVARSLEKLEQLLTASPSPTVLIVDLNVSGLDPLAAIRVAKSQPNPPKITAFLSHVQVDLAAGAREAGADQVLPRSTFTQQLPALIAGPSPLPSTPDGK
jgi:CheY-like chemotaxis protein